MRSLHEHIESLLIAFAALKAKENERGKLTLDHVKKFHMELKAANIDIDKMSPVLLPDYRRKETIARMIDI